MISAFLCACAVVAQFSSAGVAYRVTHEGNAVWRIRSAAADGSFAETGAVQALARWMDEPVPGTGGAPVEDGTRVEVTESPLSLSFFAADGTCVKRIVGLSASHGKVRVTGSLAADERVMGLGQRLDRLEQRGCDVTLCTTDGYNDSSSSYLAVPFFVTSAGGGVFANGYETVHVDLGKEVADRWTLEQDRSTLDLYVFAVRTPAESIARYTALAGRPSMPTGWSEGPVVCRYSPDLSILEGVTSRGREGRRFLGFGIKDMLAKYRAEGVEPTAFICEGWGTDLFAGTPERAAQKRAETKAAGTWLADEGKRMMVWMSLGSPLSTNAPGFKADYLVHVDIETNGAVAAANQMHVPQVRRGGASNPDVSNPAAGRLILDLTDPEAWRWYVDVVWAELIRCGVRGAKIDFCEEFPDEGVCYGNARFHYRWRNPEVFAGAAVHHGYPAFFISKLVRDLSARLKDRGGFSVLSRGGGIGSQRAPWMWAGDQQRLFEKLDDQLLAVLTSGMSGIPFMTYDAAGYQYAKPTFVPAAVYDPKTGRTDVARTMPRTGEERVYLRRSGLTSEAEEARIFSRGIELAAWTGCVQTHGFVRNPYDFDAVTREIHRKAMRRFAALAPYRRELFAEACRTGLPPVRALALVFPEDPVAWTVEDEFMLGDRYLVAPVLDDSLAREVYLPQGRWTCLRTGRSITAGRDGLRFRTGVPIDEIAVYERMNR